MKSNVEHDSEIGRELSPTTKIVNEATRKNVSVIIGRFECLFAISYLILIWLIIQV